ncbi:MAG: hypothetical protein U0531_02195 [Dehalococcoidia bacterium]
MADQTEGVTAIVHAWMASRPQPCERIVGGGCPAEERAAGDSGVAGGATDGAKKVDTVLHGGRWCCATPPCPWISRSRARRLRRLGQGGALPDAERVIDVTARSVLPGMIDAHSLHPRRLDPGADPVGARRRHHHHPVPRRRGDDR